MSGNVPGILEFLLFKTKSTNLQQWKHFLFFFFLKLSLSFSLKISNTHSSAMAEEFVRSVQHGLALAKRIYFGKDQSVSGVPKQRMSMEKDCSESFLPNAPMVYAAIVDPGMVDNCDIPSYQPHVHGNCSPPALIPLQMNWIEMEIKCYLDTAFVTVTGSWRVHCVSRSFHCDCRIAIPMGEQGSVLGFDIDVSGSPYSTHLISMEEKIDVMKEAKAREGGFLTPQIFTLTIPWVDGGSNLLVKASWSQKILYNAGQLVLSVPFSFPEYVNPTANITPQREKIQLNVNSGTGLEVLFKTSSHPLKEIKRQVGELELSYESEVLTWSDNILSFSYTIASADIFGGVVLQSPSAHDFDRREMFCFYLFPGDGQSKKVFSKSVIFVVDISGSMKGSFLEGVKNGIYTALFELNPEDSFSIIAFNEETCMFSSSLEQATNETIENAIEWIGANFIAVGGSNILLALRQAMEMLLPCTSDSIPHIFLITDGSVEDERHICNTMKGYLTDRGSTFPRISTFGIGTYCNHYFLQMLALIGRGHYDSAWDSDSINFRIQRLLPTASSVIAANITIENLGHLDALEVHPLHFPDLLSGKSLVISGRYQGKFPNALTLKGILADKSDFIIDLKVQNAKGIPLDKVVAKQQINLLTAQAWFLESKQLEEKIVKISIQSGFPSEYTRMVLLVPDGCMKKVSMMKEVGLYALTKINSQKPVDPKGHTLILLQSLGIGFGNVNATKGNIPPGFKHPNLVDPEPGALAKAASNCCGRVGDTLCCMCLIQTCSKMNNQCAIVLSQLCAALSCFGCLSLCMELCLD